MTCIVGLVDNGVVYIGADSLGSNGYTKTVRNDRKVFKLKNGDNSILGFTTSFRMGQLLMYADNLIDKKDTLNINHEYLVTKFVPNVIKLFESNGYGRNNDGEKYGGTFLIGHKDRLYKIESDYQVEEAYYNFNACGSGEDFALGSLYSTINSNLSPEQRVIYALKASSEFSTGVQPPFYIMNTKNNEIIEYRGD